MANFNARQSGPAQAARPERRRGQGDGGALQHLPEPDVAAGRGREQGGPHHARPTSWSISGQRVEDREITLDEGMVELRDYEKEIRAMLKR